MPVTLQPTNPKFISNLYLAQPHSSRTSTIWENSFVCTRHFFYYNGSHYKEITVKPLWKGQGYLTKVVKLVHFYAPFFTNHVYFTLHERPPFRVAFERPPFWMAFIKGFHCMQMFQLNQCLQTTFIELPSRAGVKYVLSNTNTNTNTFFSGVSNTNTNTNTPAKIWSNTNTNTAHQIQIQIHNEAETKLPPFYRWHIEIYCIVRRLFIHSNFTENCFQRSNLQ